MNLKKILIIGFVFVAVLLIGLLLMVHLLVTPERVKGWAVPLLEEHLQREVSIGDVEIGLFSGIALNNLQIRARDGQQHLFKIGELGLSYQLLPLLSGRLAIDDIRMIGPEIRIEQYADGSLSIDDLLTGSAKDSDHSPPSPELQPGGRDIDLLVKRVLLEGGQMLLVRRGADDIHLQGVRVLATDISLDKPFPLELSVRYNETDFLFDGEFAPANHTGRLNLSITQLDLNRFIPQQQSSTDKKPKPEEGTDPGSDVGPIEVPIDLSGTVKVDELLYQELTVKQIQAEYRLADNHFQLQPLSGNIADGQFKLQADVDLGRKGLAYTGSFSMDGLDLQSLIPVLVPQAENSTHGLIQLKIGFDGTGTDPAKALKQLASQGSFTLSNGKLMGSPLLIQLATFLNNPELKILSFQSFSGKYDLQRGLAQVEAILDSSKTRIDSSGTVDLDGDLDLQFATRLAPDMIKGAGSGSPIGRALTDPDGWAVLPLKIAGTYMDPKFSLSGAGMREQAKEKVKEKVQEKIQEKLGDKLPVKDLVDQPLKKLFGD